MNTNPLVTACIASYNHEKYITEAINSLLQQTYPNIELIVIDDGSSDNSPQIIAELAKKHNFTFITQENMGVTKTLNKIISLAKGKYLTSLASDDIAMKERISIQVELLENNPQFDSCGGSFSYINDEGKTLNTINKGYRELEFEDIFLGKKAGVNIATVMFTINSIREIGGYDEKLIGEDINLLFALTNKGHKIAVIEDVVTKYRLHNNNLHKNYSPLFFDTLAVFDKYQSHPLYPNAKRRYLKKSFRRASKYDKDLAKKILKLMDKKCYFDLKTIKGLFSLYFK